MLYSTVTCRVVRYSRNMSQQLRQTPILNPGFEDRWAAWQARGDANDRATKRKLFAVAVILILSVAILNRLGLLA